MSAVSTRAAFLRSNLFAEGSLAKTSLTLDDVPGCKASRADYGLTSPASFAKYDPATCSWKTSQVSLFGGWGKWSATWPLSGMTRNGTAYRLRPSAPRIYDRASGFLPTPVASESKRTGPYSQGGLNLSFVLGGRPNPEYVEWMMGFPAGWTEIDVLGTRLSRRLRKR